MDQIIDVGANVGQFAVTLAEMHPEARLLSVEPNPTVLPYLERNTAALRDRVTVLGVAVGPDYATVDFHYVPKKSAQGSRLSANTTVRLLGTHSFRTILVEERPLTQGLLDTSGWTRDAARTLVKLDVEGYELSALAGLKDTQFEWLWMETIPDRLHGLSTQVAADEVARVLGRPAILVGSFGINTLIHSPYR